ncbi:RNA polymerase sigma factor [Flavonifractor sp. An100]|uniref:RNA polymerase sigma factor n=1 Tax=Flavonifractor sp. An100 TaxID=1965538 RepID=UPI000B369F77|nr:RNA polymerase sigma factor [Flavonifractor sp. An100]OUQ78622.1 RNA polymerase subunit sigma-24 [Flavonifractor sp. An100]
MDPAVLQQEVEEEILRSYQMLYRLAYTYVKNPDDAMDVVQESVYKAIQNASGVRSRGAIKGWLCRIVANTALDFLRSRAREVPVDQVPETGREDTYQDLDTLRALERLEERERTVVVLRFFEDMKLQDIALSTGENLNTVKTILYRSLKKLRIQLMEGESFS